MTDTLDRLVRRTRLYWYEDGFVELITGGLFVLVGLGIAMTGPLSVGPVGRAIAGVLLPILLIAGILLGRRLIAAAKEKITYPRTGFVGYQRPSRKQRMRRAGTVAAAVATVVTISALLPEGSRHLMVLLQGTVTGLLLILVGRRVPRFYVLGALVVALGAALSQTGNSPEAASALLFGLAGAAMMATGAVVLTRYLARNRTAAADEPGDDGGPAK